MSLPYSSGTTGLAKGVMLSHRNMVANLLQMGVQLPMDDHDVIAGVLPFFHIYGQTVVMNAGLLAGATIVTLPRFDLGQLLRLIGITASPRPTSCPRSWSPWPSTRRSRASTAPPWR